MFGYISDTTTA